MEIENLAEKAENFTGNVWKLENGEVVLVDTGTGDSWQEISKLEEIHKVVITHSHYDHVDNLPKIADRFEPAIYGFKPPNLPVEAEKLADGEEIKLAGATFRIIHTPGHRDDSICLYSPREKILFTGDLVFPQGGFGRTDLKQGDRELLIESIEKLVNLDVEEFYPGHDPAATEDAEKQIERTLEEAEKRELKY